jgi:hypothetical protein
VVLVWVVPSDEEKAIEATKTNPSVQSFIQSVEEKDLIAVDEDPKRDEYLVKARQPRKKEVEEYPVIFEDTSDAVLVEYQYQDQGLLCVVDDDVVKRCFNHISIG